jgi:hypothetical protein
MQSKQVFHQEKTWKPSGTKANARYRGVTDLEQYSNFVLESAHDMTLLSHVLTGNEKTGVPGHEKAIQDNYIALFNGGVSPVAYDSFTASTLVRLNRNKPIAIPAIETWQSVGGASVVKTSAGYQINSPGTYSTAGIHTSLYVSPGDIICIRLRAQTNTDLLDFSIGSDNLNGIGSLQKFPIKTDTYGFYVDYRLYCRNHETIFLSIYLHDKPATTPVACSAIISDVGLYYADEVPVSLAPLNGELKTDLNIMRETLNFLKS